MRFEDGTITEYANLRSNISSTNTVSEDIAKKRRDYLPATDVKWSTGNFKNFIATAANHGRIALYDVSRAEVERAWVHEHTGPVHRLAFDPHIGTLLLSGSHDGSVKMWDLRALTRASQTMKSVGSFLSKKAGVRDVKWCPTQATDALEFALCTDTGVIQKWDLRKPNQPLLSINAHGKSCLAIDWHPDGKHLVSGGLDRLVKVWDFHNDKGNQKAKFELNAPQAIRNIKWRPPCWSSEFTGTGHWQCTQFATSYHQDDPRVHIWDLRRPHLPFRELERYKNPATDLLWASKDLIWTVGDEGWFTQTDVNFARLIHHSIAPGAIDWFPDGQYAAFSDSIGVRRESGFEDPAVGFLSVPHEKLSSGEEMAISNSFSDEETSMEGRLPNTFSRRQSRAASTKSGKSQNNTPPAPNGFPAILSLEKAVSSDIFNNKQIGMKGEVTGLCTDPHVVSFLAKNYARPSSEAERKAEPESILERLEAAFRTNADACDEVSMHRTAQSWRILSSVIVPELRYWASKNREERLEQVVKQKAARMLWEEQESKITPVLVKPSPGGSIESKAHHEKQDKPRGNLFKGIIGSERHERYNVQHDSDSNSNMTTPVARPLPDSPISDVNSPESRYQNLDERLERLPQLPPSLLASHSTAAAASRALRETSASTQSRRLSPSSTSESESSPFKSKHRRAESSQSLRSLQNLSPSTGRPPAPSQALLSSPLALRPTLRAPPSQRQEDRRAALRDYQKQARPLLTFDEPPSSPTPSGGISSQSFGNITSQASSDQQLFPMFSTSDSSHDSPADGGSLPFRPLPDRDAEKNATGSAAGYAGQATFGAQQIDASGRREATAHQRGVRSDLGTDAEMDERRRTAENIRAKRARESYEITEVFGVDSASDGFRFGMDGIAVSRDEARTKKSDDGDTAWDDWAEDGYARHTKGQKSHATRSSISSSPHEPFEFDQEAPATRRIISQPREYHVNPFIREKTSVTVNSKDEHPAILPIENTEELGSTDFIFYDFQPIDLTKYKPPTPFAWSALPLITQVIAFDLDNGPGCAQFSVNLLAHIHPYFFHQCYRSRPTLKILSEVEDFDLADRLMHPSLNSRIFEHIFMEHDRYLKRIGMFVQMAEFRKLCAEFEYASVYTEDQGAIENGLASATPYVLSIICANPDCRAPMQDGEVTCQRCRTARSVCPVCSALKYDPDLSPKESESVDSAGKKHDRSLWAYCHGCGHSAHLGCLEDWLAHPFSEGECPTSTCGHDCGPGKARVARIAAQVEEGESEKTAKPAAVKGVQGDKWKVNASAAVERTRKSLRSLNDRGTQSGDESGRIRSSFSSRSGSGLVSGRSGRGSFSGQSQGQRKSVRLVTPNEERESSQAIE